MAAPRWLQIGGKLTCELHGETFPSGRVCSQCDGLAPVTHIAEPSSDAPPARRLFSVAEHEMAMQRVAVYAANLSKRIVRGAQDVSEKADPCTVAAKWMDVSMKARRAAAEYAQKREDWAQTAKLEEAARQLDRSRETMRDRGGSH